MTSEKQQNPLTVGPAVQNATQIALTMNDGEIALTLGLVRQMFGNEGPVGLSLEWTNTFGLSPTTAKKLAEGLTTAVKAYEDQFGAIPMDPKTSAPTPMVISGAK